MKRLSSVASRKNPLFHQHGAALLEAVASSSACTTIYIQAATIPPTSTTTTTVHVDIASMPKTMTTANAITTTYIQRRWISSASHSDNNNNNKHSIESAERDLKNREEEDKKSFSDDKVKMESTEKGVKEKEKAGGEVESGQEKTVAPPVDPRTPEGFVADLYAEKAKKKSKEGEEDQKQEQKETTTSKPGESFSFYKTPLSVRRKEEEAYLAAQRRLQAAAANSEKEKKGTAAQEQQDQDQKQQQHQQQQVPQQQQVSYVPPSASGGGSPAHSTLKSRVGALLDKALKRNKVGEATTAGGTSSSTASRGTASPDAATATAPPSAFVQQLNALSDHYVSDEGDAVERKRKSQAEQYAEERRRMLTFRDVEKDRLDATVLRRDTLYAYKVFFRGKDFFIDTIMERELRYYREFAEAELSAYPKLFHSMDFLISPSTAKPFPSLELARMSDVLFKDGQKPRRGERYGDKKFATAKITPETFRKPCVVILAQFGARTSTNMGSWAQLIPTAEGATQQGKQQHQAVKGAAAAALGAPPFSSKRGAPPKKNKGDQGWTKMNESPAESSMNVSVAKDSDDRTPASTVSIAAKPVINLAMKLSGASFFKKQVEKHLLVSKKDASSMEQAMVNLNAAARERRLPIGLDFMRIRSIDFESMKLMHRTLVNRYAQSLTPEERHLNYVGKRVVVEFMDTLKIRNFMPTYCMLVDHRGRIRWIAMGDPSVREKEIFPKLVKQLLEEYQRERSI